MDQPGRADVRAASGPRPVLCPEQIYNTIIAMVMNFCGWIDLIKGECSTHEP